MKFHWKFVNHVFCFNKEKKLFLKNAHFILLLKHMFFPYILVLFFHIYIRAFVSFSSYCLCFLTELDSSYAWSYARVIFWEKLASPLLLLPWTQLKIEFLTPNSGIKTCLEKSLPHYFPPDLWHPSPLRPPMWQCMYIIKWIHSFGRGSCI